MDPTNTATPSSICSADMKDKLFFIGITAAAFIITAVAIGIILSPLGAAMPVLLSTILFTSAAIAPIKCVGLTVITIHQFTKMSSPLFWGSLTVGSLLVAAIAIGILSLTSLPVLASGLLGFMAIAAIFSTIVIGIAALVETIKNKGCSGPPFG